MKLDFYLREKLIGKAAISSVKGNILESEPLIISNITVYHSNVCLILIIRLNGSAKRRHLNLI